MPLLLRVFVGRWWVPVLTAAIAVGAAWSWTGRQTPVYRASQLLAVVPGPSIEGGSDILRSLEALERRTLLATFARLASSNQTRRGVGERLDRDEPQLAPYRFSASVLSNTNILRVEVDGPDRDVAMELAEAVSATLAADAQTLYRIYALEPISTAEASRQPTFPDRQRNYLAAAVLGLLVGVAVVGAAAQFGRPRR